MHDRNEPYKKATSAVKVRRILPLALLVLGLLWLTACGGVTDSGSVTSVTIDQEPFTLAVDSEFQLTATVAVDGDASKTVTWRSSDTSVATVDGDGTVTGLAVGSATITASSAVDASKSDSVTATVIPAVIEVVPPTLTFTAAPSQINSGESATLTWMVEGDYDSIRITRPNDVVVAQDLAASGTQEVSPTSNTTYTLEVRYDDGLLITAVARVGVTAPLGAADISDFSAQVLRGSQIRLAWAATGGTSWQVFATGSGTEISLGSGSGSGTTLTAPIPPSTHQHFRLDVTNALGTTSEDISAPTTIVINTEDYDRYDASDVQQEEAIPGSLRSVVREAEPGSIIGFASDITAIDLRGVEFYRPDAGAGESIGDAHLAIEKDLVISGPDGGRVTLKGVSGRPDDDDSQPLTWHSRMVLVAPGVTAELENLELTGGDFIYYGAGIGNMGTLTATNLLITGNRAFGSGGGIHNFATGDLTLVDSVVSDNGAFMRDEEVGVTWNIRGNPTGTTFDGVGGYGGGISNVAGGVISIRNSNIVDNEARFSGGGIYNVGAITASEDTQINGNSANFTAYLQAPGEVSYGGGIMNGGVATFSMSGGTINGNLSAEQGGGLWLAPTATATLTNVNIGDNEVGLAGVDGYGGGILHNFFTGEEDNLSLTGQSYTPENTANRGGATVTSNLEAEDRGLRPAGLNPASIDPLQYRLAPLPPR